MKNADLCAGHRFGRLTLIELTGCRNKRGVIWRCVCDCGSVKEANATDLRIGDVKSCGCLGAERIRALKYKHGMAKKGETVPEFWVWSEMHTRCENPKNKHYHRYGGRGISVCERWGEFGNFIADMGNRPGHEYSIDRMDNDGNYEPGNCRWTTASVQANNKGNNVLIAFSGRAQTAWEWAREYGIHPRTLLSRLYQLEWPVEKALTFPVKGRKQVAAE